MAASSKISVGFAIGGNTLVMCAKFFAFLMTGSAAMLSEAIHTLADVLNQILLMIGIVRSDKQADRRFPYGYQRERYIWALMSAVGIFFLGCGVTLYHGIQGLIHPHSLRAPWWALGTLLFALIVEGIVLVVAFRSLWRQKQDKKFFAFLRDEADPSEVAVLLEDAAACLGVLIAAACIGLSLWTQQHFWDALGSILIGILLGLVAIWLIWRNTYLLRGPSIPEHAAERVKQIIEEDPHVESVVQLKSRMIDLKTWDIMANIEFEGESFAHKFSAEIQEAWERVKDFEGFQRFCVEYADLIIHALGEEIDHLEARIQEEFPEAKHLDLEAESSRIHKKPAP